MADTARSAALSAMRKLTASTPSATTTLAAMPAQAQEFRKGTVDHVDD